MGQILSQPVIEKSSEQGGDESLSYGLSCMQGWRISMEDSHATVLNLNDQEEKDSNDKDNKKDTNIDKIAFFGVYDGHGGEKVALFTGAHMPEIIKNTKAFREKNYQQALKDGFLATDTNILLDEELSKDPSGCAATSAFITEDKIICGNAGDSRTIMSVAGIVKPLSFDHKPTNEAEKARICAAGGYVDVGRVNGNLALSRGIGDFEFKDSPQLPPEEQVVTAFPDVIEHVRTANDEFVVLACDGIWDCLTSQQVVDFVRRGVKENQSLPDICESMMNTCLAPTSGGSGIGCDNMSVCIVALLLNNESLEEWYTRIGEKMKDDKPLPTPDELSMELYNCGIDAKISDKSSERNSMDGRSSGLTSRKIFNDDDDENDDDDKHTGGRRELSGSPALIQQLLAASNISTDNNIIYLDSSTSSVLQSLGVQHMVMGDEDEDEDYEDSEKMDVDNKDDKKIEEVEEDDKSDESK